MLDELDGWRKTHYTHKVTPDLIDKEVILGGWVRNFRDLGGLKFISLQDKYGIRQITIKRALFQMMFLRRQKLDTNIVLWSKEK